MLGPEGKRRLRLLPRLRSPRSSLRSRSWWRGLEAALAFTLPRLPFTRRTRRWPPLQCASARLANSRDTVPREVRPDALGARLSPPSPPTPPCSASQSGVIEPAAAVTRAVARASFPERAEGRAQLGPTPPDLRSPCQLRVQRVSRKRPSSCAHQSARRYLGRPFLIKRDVPVTSSSWAVESLSGAWGEQFLRDPLFTRNPEERGCHSTSQLVDSMSYSRENRYLQQL